MIVVNYKEEPVWLLSLAELQWREEEESFQSHMAWKAKGAVRSLSMIFLQWKDHTRSIDMYESLIFLKKNFYHKQRNSE